MIKLQTKPNTNGNTYQVLINTENKTLTCGYFLFVGKTDTRYTRKQLKNIVNDYISQGYKEV